MILPVYHLTGLIILLSQEVAHLMKTHTFASRSEVYVFMPLRGELLPGRSFLFFNLTAISLAYDFCFYKDIINISFTSTV